MKKRLLSICVLALVFFPIASISAEENDSSKAAKELFKAINLEKSMLEGIEASIDVQMNEFAQMGLPPEGVAELKEEMFSFFTEVMKYEKMEPEFIRIYTESFSAEEMREMIVFYKTPIGKKAVQLLPQLTAQGMAVGQNMIQDRSRELQQRIIPVFQKHMPRDPVQPAAPVSKE